MFHAIWQGSLQDWWPTVKSMYTKAWTFFLCVLSVYLGSYLICRWHGMQKFYCPSFFALLDSNSFLAFQRRMSQPRLVWPCHHVFKRTGLHLGTAFEADQNADVMSVYHAEIPSFAWMHTIYDSKWDLFTTFHPITNFLSPYARDLTPSVSSSQSIWAW